MSLAGLGDSQGALRLVSAVDAELQRMGVNLRVSFWDALLDRYLGIVREALDAECKAWLSEEGRRITFENAISIGLEQGAEFLPRGETLLSPLP